MSYRIYCDAKHEDVDITSDSINASAKEDMFNRYIPGRLNCSGKDVFCEQYAKCALDELIKKKLSN